MNRKHYERAVQLIQEEYGFGHNPDGVHRVLTTFSRFFSEDNKRFDSRRFCAAVIQACGLPGVPSKVRAK